MRNYIALNLARLNFNFTGPNDPPTASWWVTGTSIEDLTTQIAWAQTVGSFTLVEIEDLGVYYFPLDKANLSKLWNYAIAGQPLNGPLFQRDPFSDSAKPDPNAAPANSPRKGWTDTAGVKREPPPSEGGAGILNLPNYRTSLAQQLELIYNRLYQAHQITAANLVLPVLKKVLNGTVTQADIDDLFAKLKRYGI